MKPVKNNFKLIGKIYLIIGVSLSAATLVFIMLRVALDSETAKQTFFALSLTFGIQGVVWLILGISFYMHGKRKDILNEQLKKDGIKYEAEIVQIVPKPIYVRAGNYMTAYAECCYINQEGKRCLVKSSMFMHDSNEKLGANVYVSPHNPRCYFVEIFPENEKSVQYDYDYR